MLSVRQDLPLQPRRIKVNGIAGCTRLRSHDLGLCLHIQRMVSERIDHRPRKQPVQLLKIWRPVREAIVTIASAGDQLRIPHHYPNLAEFAIPVRVRWIVRERVKRTSSFHAAGNLSVRIIQPTHYPATVLWGDLLKDQLSSGVIGGRKKSASAKIASDLLMHHLQAP